MKKLLSVGYITWFWAGCIPPLLTKGSASVYASVLTFPFLYQFMIRTSQWSGVQRLSCVIFVAVVMYLIALAAIPVGSPVLSRWVRTYRPNRRELKKLDWDQYEIIVDEAFGFIICCWPLTLFHNDHLAITMVIGAVSFHLIDGMKIWPASYFDRTTSASGIMLDDLSAGIYASGIVLIATLWL